MSKRDCVILALWAFFTGLVLTIALTQIDFENTWTLPALITINGGVNGCYVGWLITKVYAK